MRLLIPAAAFLPLSLSLIAASTVCLAEGDKNHDIKWSKAHGKHRQRILDFPKTYSVGTLVISPPPRKGEPGSATMSDARGRIIVPAGDRVTLEATVGLLKDPSIINTLPADGLDSLRTHKVAFVISEEGSWDQALAFVGHLQGLDDLVLNQSGATDTGIAHVAQLANLDSLSLADTLFRGGALKQLRMLKNLRFLRISENEIAEENLRYLRDFPGLKSLIVSRVRLSDAGMQYLGQCTGLIVLDVSCNNMITDSSLKFLTGLKQLQVLRVDNTRVTARGLTQLKGLPLRSIKLSERKLNQSDRDALLKAFPGVDCQTLAQKTLDEDTQPLLEPLH